MSEYRGRLAPSPTGYLHLGHARTFWTAYQRARAARGKLVFRNEDLDFQRCKPEFVAAMYEDLRWLGLSWDEGPDVGGEFGPYSQNQRRDFYLEAWLKLRDGGFIYPCTCSRKDLEKALSAPHEDGEIISLPSGRTPAGQTSAAQTPAGQTEDDELHYPGTCRDKITEAMQWSTPEGVSWRFKVPDYSLITFTDLHFGSQQFLPGQDFSDFLVWRRDDIPAYQLAVVVDDEAMKINEVVRGADLLRSTARQLLLIDALGYALPNYFHCPLLRDEHNVRLAKRHDSLSLQILRAQGVDPGKLRQQFGNELNWKNQR
jgi:glutamyl/glutaminyl-tRNA synthetase